MSDQEEREGFACLSGKTVKAVHVSDGEHYLWFQFEDGSSRYFLAEGDCCSESWFADILGLWSLLDEKAGPVLAVEELKLPGYDVDDGRGRQDADCVYGYKVSTQLGFSTIVMRNSSNGYYGGSVLMEPTEPKEYATHGGYGTPRDRAPMWKPITEDWKA